METKTKQRLSRYDDSPVLDARDRPIAIQLTERDLEIFKLLSRYRYLRSSFLHAFIGGNYAALKRRLKPLARKPNKFLHKPQAQFNVFNANYRHLIYELAEPGQNALRQSGIEDVSSRLGDERQFSHAMMINDTLASLALGAQSARLVSWAEIARHPKFPPRAPHKLHVRIRKHFAQSDRVHHAEFDYTNDSDGIFAIDDGGPYRFFSLEAEHTNRVDCNNLQQTSFLKKFLAIQAIMDGRLYQKAWGLPHLLHLVVVPSQARIDTMKTLILRETNGKGVPYILFREIPVMEGFRPIRPMPELYTEPWQRAGYPALSINHGK